jgi:6-phosphogluconate dehydrogenase
MTLLGAAGREYGWGLDLGAIAALWRGGCIIRSRFLNRIMDAYARNPGLQNLLLDPFLLERIAACQDSWRRVVTTAIDLGIPAPAFGASLDYFDSYRRERLPANLIQAQRDYFGAHTYERANGEGVFHTDWTR